jgi:hypothetical protein
MVEFDRCRQFNEQDCSEIEISDFVMCENTRMYSKPTIQFEHSITNIMNYFSVSYLEKCIKCKLEPTVATVWLQPIIDVLYKYEELYGNKMVITIPRLLFYIHNMPFLEIVNTNHFSYKKLHNIRYKIYYFPIPRSLQQPRHVDVVE